MWRTHPKRSGVRVAGLGEGVTKERGKVQVSGTYELWKDGSRETWDCTGCRYHPAKSN